MTHAPGLPRNQSLQRTVTLLRAVAAHPEGATIATLAAETSLPRPTTSRLLATLADAEFVERAGASDGWVLGREILSLGRAADPYGRLAQLAQPHLEQLARDAAESAMLGASDRSDRLEVIAQADAGNLVGVGNWVGRRFGLHASAGGKLILAGLADAGLEAALAGMTLERYTARTLTTRAALQAELRRVRRLGYAETVDELEIGLSSIGVVVGPMAGSVLLSVGVSGPTSRLSTGRRRELVPLIHACADRIRAACRPT
jgi:DNA-binding IclR family transcriptional regulator